MLLNLIFAKVIEEHTSDFSDLIGSIHWFQAGMLQNRLERNSNDKIQ